MDEITEFRGPYAFLSNFARADTMYDDVLYPTSEHAYQAAKVMPYLRSMLLEFSPKPRYAKELGRKLRMRPDWEEVKLSCMYAVVLDKFQRNSRLGDLLLATGDAKLVEGNTWGDRFWGMTYTAGPLESSAWQGENHLGIILMQVRDVIRKERS